jgi:hypothetical protein
MILTTESWHRLEIIIACPKFYFVQQSCTVCELKNLKNSSRKIPSTLDGNQIQSNQIDGSTNFDYLAKRHAK